jgi:hypothetical protein
MSSELQSAQIPVFEFEDFLNMFLEEHDINDADIIAFRVRDNTCKIYLSTGDNIDFTINDFINHKLSILLLNESILYI